MTGAFFISYHLSGGAAIISLVVIIPWWMTVTQGSGEGATLVDHLVLVALLLPWGGRIAQAIR